jgi:hypothetical protein
MEQSAGEIRLTSSDAEINALLQREIPSRTGFTRHFSQGEDFFIRLGHDYTVPSFSIHHDVSQSTPAPQYITKLRGLIDTIQSLVPSLFDGLTYLFDPSEVLRPVFFQLYRVAGEPYLYLMRLDLVCRPQKHLILEKGTNDTTPVYRTRDLMIDADIVPLTRLLTENNKTTGGVIDHMISDTWIGETGRGYFVQGIWLDTDLTKFFSKLILPAGKRVYPYYPFSSKYRSVCYHPIALGPAARREAVPLLHRVKHFLAPHLSEIERVLREEAFSESLPAFTQIKETVPEEWQQVYKDLTMDVYLNDEEQKEFEVHDGARP